MATPMTQVAHASHAVTPLRQLFVRASGAVSLVNILLLIVSLELTYRIATPAVRLPSGCKRSSGSAN